MPQCGIEFGQDAGAQSFVVGVFFEDGKYGGSGAGHHGGDGLGLLKEEEFEFGEEAVFFENRALEVVDESVSVDILWAIGDFRDLLGVLPA